MPDRHYSVVNSSFAIDLPSGLIDRARRGDAAAQEQIYRRFERPVYTLALRLLGQPDAALDVLQDVFLAVFRGLPEFRGDSPFWGWLRQIAVRTAIAALRTRREREPADGDGLLADASLDALPATTHGLLQSLALEQALQTLPPITRSVLWLQLVEGYTHAEIGAQYGQSPSFSKSQLARGLKQLRALLIPEAACPTTA